MRPHGFPAEIAQAEAPAAEAREIRGCGAPHGTKGLRSGIAIGYQVSAARRPRGDFPPVPPSRALVPLPDAADKSHYRQVDSLQRRRVRGVTPAAFQLRIPAPFGHAGRPPSQAGMSG